MGLPFSKAVVSIVFVGLIVLSLIRFFSTKTDYKSQPFLLFPIFIFMVLGISVFYSDNLQVAFKNLLSQIEFLALPFIFYSFQDLIRQKFAGFINTFLIATTVAALITLLFFVLPNELTLSIVAAIPLLKDYVVHEKAYAFGVYSPFIDRLQFSYLLGVALFFQLGLLIKAFKIGLFFKKGAVFVLVILGLTLLILGARGAQISFLLASIFWIVGTYWQRLHPMLSRKFSHTFSLFLLLVGLFSFLVVIPTLAYKTVPAVKMRYEQLQWELGTFKNGTFKNYDYIHFTSIRRWLSWKNSWTVIKENPILGVGVGDYATVMEQEYQKDKLGFPVNTQSQFLYYWVVAGIAGLGSLLLLFGYAFFHFFTQKNTWLKGVGLSFFTFYLLLFLFDAPLNFQVGAMTFLVFYGLIGLTATPFSQQ